MLIHCIWRYPVLTLTTGRALRTSEAQSSLNGSTKKISDTVQDTALPEVSIGDWDKEVRLKSKSNGLMLYFLRRD